MYTHARIVGNITRVSTSGIALARMQVLGQSRLSQATLPACARCIQSGKTKMPPRVSQKATWCVSSPDQASKKRHTYVSAWSLSSHLTHSSPRAPRLLWVGRELIAGSRWTDNWFHPFPRQGGPASWSPGRIRCPTPHWFQC